MLSPRPHFHVVSLCLSPTYLTTPGKENAEEQPDKLLLSVRYFCQYHRKPLCQDSGTGVVVFYDLDCSIMPKKRVFV